MRDITLQAQSPAETDYYAERVYSSEREELNLRDYWKILVKRRRVVILLSLILLGFGAYVNYSATPMYTATAILLIEPQIPIVTGIGQVMPQVALVTPWDQTQIGLLKSRPLAERVITDLRLESNPVFTNTPVVGSNAVGRLRSLFFSPLRFVLSYISWVGGPRPKYKDESSSSVSRAGPTLGTNPGLINRYLSFLEVDLIKNTRMVQIVLTTPDPQLSQELANAHATAFIRMNLETRFSLTNEAREFLDKKNTELKAKLERSEQSLNSFRQQHGIVSLDKGENLVVDRLMDINRQLTRARTERIETESLHRMVENRNAQYLTQVISNSLISQLKATLASFEADQVRLATMFKPDHPRMLELTAQIAEARRALNNEIANIVRNVESNYSAAQAREQALQAEANKQQQAALNLKEIGVQYAVLQEEVNVNRTLYESVLKRLSETSVSNDVAVSNIQITQRAEMSPYPSLPRQESNLLFAGALGIFFGIALAFFLEYVDSTVSTPEAVWHAIQKPTLGVVPHLNSLSRRMYRSERLLNGFFTRFPVLHLPGARNNNLLFSRHPVTIIADSFRTIRTAVLLSRPEKPPQVILVSSASPGEGKTVAALNLAIVFAQGGKSVLVIDADLRNGRCHTALGLSSKKGLTDVLTGSLAVQESVWKTAVAGLSLLPRGPTPPYPPDLLGSDKMAQVLDSMRRSFDVILIDSPPVVAMADAAVLSGICDSVILVVHGQSTTASSARQAMERLAVVRARVLGVVLNGVDIRNPEYAYYRYYRSYGYSAASDQPEGNGKRPVEVWAKARLARYADDLVVLARYQRERLNGWIESRLGMGLDINREKTRVHEDEISETELSSEELKPGTVPQEFFDQMLSSLREAVGPMALVIIDDHIQHLRETREAFPKGRIEELLIRVCEEIANEQLKNHFRQKMQPKIAALKNRDSVHCDDQSAT